MKTKAFRIRQLLKRRVRPVALKLLSGQMVMESAEVRSTPGRRRSQPTGPAFLRSAGRARWLWFCTAGVAVAAALAGCTGGGAHTSQVPSVALLPPPPPTPGPDYRLQLGDTMKVQFLFQPENDIDLVVRPDGRISLSAAGEIEAVGKTEQELEAIIRERAGEHMRDPKVTVTVT